MLFRKDVDSRAHYLLREMEKETGKSMISPMLSWDGGQH